MKELAPGVTRYPADPTRIPRRGSVVVEASSLVVAVVFAGLSIARGGSPLDVVLVVLVAVVVPPLTIVLPLAPLRVVVSVAAALTALVTLGPARAAGAFLAVATLGGLVAGSSFLARLGRRRWWRRRLAGAEGAPAAGLNPRGGQDVGTLAWWIDQDHQYEMVDPSAEVVLAAVRDLDGRRRSVVSVYRGAGRLDVGGNAAGPMIVQQSDDRVHWFQVVEPVDRPGAEDATGVVLAGAVLGTPRWRLTDRESAERAVRTWLADGVRDPALEWQEHSKWDRAENRRPPGLRSTD